MRLVCQREPIGADRRDIGLAKAIAQLAIVTAGSRANYQEIVKSIMPVKLWDDATAEDDFETLMSFSRVHNAAFERHGPEHFNPEC